MRGLKGQCCANRKQKCKPDTSAWEGIELAKIYDSVSKERERANKATRDNEMYQKKCRVLEEELKQLKLEREGRKEENTDLKWDLEKTRTNLREAESKLENMSEHVIQLQIHKSNIEKQNRIIYKELQKINSNIKK